MRVSRRSLLGQFVLFGGWLFAAVFPGGCDRDRHFDRVLVSGTVTYKGKPIPRGQIRFVPVDGLRTPPSAANIEDGLYRDDLHGGVPPGTYRVEIEAYEKVTTPPDPMRIQKNYLPKRHGTDSKIRLSVPPTGREITQNFDLQD